MNTSQLLVKPDFYIYTLMGYCDLVVIHPRGERGGEGRVLPVLVTKPFLAAKVSFRMPSKK